MAAPAEPPPLCVSYGCFSASSSSYSNALRPCKTETSISLPASPSSSHSSLSLEHATSSPSMSSGTACLVAESFPYHHLPSYSFNDVPSLLDTPSNSCSSHSLYPSEESPSSLKKRPAGFLSSDLETTVQLEGLPLLGTKRTCNEAVGDLNESSSAYRGREAISSYVDHAMPFDGFLGRTNGCSENVAFDGLDDMLDILLQEADMVPTGTTQSYHESLWLDQRFDHCTAIKEEGDGAQSKLEYDCKEALVSKASETYGFNKLLGTEVRRTPAWSSNDAMQELTRVQVTAGGGGSVRDGRAAMEESERGVTNFCEQVMRQNMAGQSKCATQVKQEEEGSLLAQRGGVLRKLQGAQVVNKASCRSWAGPTLLDIESALAMTSPPSHGLSSSPFEKPPPSFLSSIRDILNRDPLSSSFPRPASCIEEPLLEEDDKLATWRRLQKRNQLEPRYTVKIRCEEDAVNDGYRWRKYGQKSIKNSPYPRSYYRCSTGKCNVKKQVERSGEDAGLLLVSYEGIHLHHRPTSLLSTSHTCVPPPPTCEPANPQPQSI